MTNQTSIEILRKMINGMDPLTGEELPRDHLCNQPEVIRALHTAILAMNATPSAADSLRDEPLPFTEGTPPVNPPDDEMLNKKNGLPNAGRPWTPADSDALSRL